MYLFVQSYGFIYELITILSNSLHLRNESFVILNIIIYEIGILKNTIAS